ncbi:MAG: glycosyltransferase family 2 protein [Chloroflexi bacterium]|nr:MAG: glycosyltransferase family 2 protein [Chloroflexota bacterium]TMF38734.1 MAG: glycosyltransferase family 2 protein [Chloroflexota bacterium]
MARQAATVAPYVSVIVLVYNEIDSVEPLHRELIGVLETLGTSFEVLYIDDGSRDGSTERLAQLAARDDRVRVVSFRRNFGQTAAVQAGIDHSRGAVLLFLDGDMQNDPHDIPHLLAKVDEGYDVASGWRRDRRDDAMRVWPSRIANWIIARVTGVRLSDFGCTLKAYRREVIQDVKLYGEMHRFMPVFASTVGARITELPVNHRPRTYGKSKYSLTRTSRVMLDLITVKLLGSYSTKPMYFFGFAAFGLWAVAFLLAAIVIGQKLLPPYVYAHNNPLLLLSVVLVIIGVQFILMGLLAELSIRTYHESQAKPTYVVREVIERTPHRQPATNGRPALRTR